MSARILPMAHTVVAVVADDIAPFELGVACEVFGIARLSLAHPWYRFILAAAEPPPLRTSSGFTIDTPHGLEALAEADTVVIPAWGHPDAPPDGDLIDALRSAHERGARMLSVCSGAFVLGYAGLLDGRRCT